MSSPEDQQTIGWRELVAANTYLLSCAYLTAGLLAEGVRRVYPAEWVIRTLFALEQTPGQVLELLGMLEPLRRYYVYGQLSDFKLHLAFGATMVLVILATASGIAFLMSAVRALLLRLLN